jgi:hypothetical protein
MKNIWLACLVGIASVAALCGCDASKMAAIEIVSVDVHDWTNPKDGKTYIVAAPTWKNTGPAVARSVTMVATLKTADGKEVTLNEPTKPLFYGGQVEPGTEVKPTRTPEDVLVLGEKDELTKKYGAITKDNVTVQAMGSETDWEDKPDNPA